MMNYANSFDCTVADTSTILETSVSSLTEDKNLVSEHTSVCLQGKKQLRCVWCSRVNLTERKTTMKCEECNAGFCRDSAGRSF
mmetsp:Transcript_18284/g.17634  ORF Transcript_18284/g.17634 Transcript_18284/m.17634 type:complete len:83 (-) Transcript_18284:213-461(-)